MFLIGQELPKTIDFMEYLGPLGVGAILAWYLWYTVSVVLPKKDLEFKDAMTKQCDKHEAIVGRILQEFREESKDQRASEHERAKISAELARNGQLALSNVVNAINKLETTIHTISHGNKT